jgi:BT1 family
MMTDGTKSPGVQVSRPGLRESSARWSFLTGTGIFATTLAQSSTLDLPLRNLLAGELQEPLHTTSLFFTIASLPWYFKIIVGVLSDSVPLFGTMRRHYLLLSGTAAGALWLLAGYVPRSYLSLLLTVTAVEAMLVVGSTAVGGLLVEAGQKLGVAGELVAARNIVEGGCTVIGGPLAGVLAGLRFESATAIAGLIAFTMVPVVFICLREPATAKYNVSALVDSYRELQRLLHFGPQLSSSSSPACPRRSRPRSGNIKSIPCIGQTQRSDIFKAQPASGPCFLLRFIGSFAGCCHSAVCWQLGFYAARLGLLPTYSILPLNPLLRLTVPMAF